MSLTMRCMAPCPPWGFCATPVTMEQFVDGGCGGIHGHDGYVTNKQIKQEAREHDLAHLADRLVALSEERP